MRIGDPEKPKAIRSEKTYPVSGRPDLVWVHETAIAVDRRVWHRTSYVRRIGTEDKPSTRENQ